MAKKFFCNSKNNAAVRGNFDLDRGIVLHRSLF